MQLTHPLAKLRQPDERNKSRFAMRERESERERERERMRERERERDIYT